MKDYVIIFDMDNLPYISMPDYFTRLLQVNMQSSSEAFRGLGETIYKNRSLYALFSLSVRDIDKDLRIEKILNAVGWYGLRDRLASLFIYYQRYGHFPDSYKNSYVTQVVHCEKKIQPLTIDGHSRGFLLALYMEMANYAMDIGLIDKKSGQVLNRLCLSFDKIDQLLRLAQVLKGKTLRVDFLLLYLGHLNWFFGSEQTLNFMKEGKEYHEIYPLMGEKEREIFLRNLLSYGASVSDLEFFVAR